MATAIVLSFDGTEMTALLDNSETSQAFIERLPMTLSMSRYGDREYYAAIEELPENGEHIEDFENGDLTYDAYSERFEAARKRMAEIAELRQERNAKKTRIRLFMENMNNHQELVQSFDEELWYSTVDYVTVYEDKRLVFTFRDGRQVEVTAELWKAA